MNLAAAFKLFDIRGLYPSVVDERLAFLVAKNLSLWKKPRQVIIASDTRVTSPRLKEFIVDGFASSNVSVKDLGLCSVPRFYYSVATTNADLGVMITASHSSADENGFKIVGENGLPLNEAEVKTLFELVSKSQGDPIVVEKGTATKIDTTDDYVKSLLRLTSGLSFPKKICVDFNDTAAKDVIQKTFAAKNIPAIEINNPLPGNPLEEKTRAALSTAVRAHQADCGLIWDSDGDRVILLDRRGELVSLSFVLGLLARQALTGSRARKVVADVRAGLIVRDFVEQVGGSLEIIPAWSQFIKFAMSEDRNIVFGGETSGHFVFSDFDLIDDGLLAAIRLLDIISHPSFDTELLRLKKKYFELPEMNFPCEKGKAALVLNQISNYYRSKDYSVSVKDGVTVFGFDWKINLRASATEPVLRLNLEARSAADAQKILDELDDRLTGLKF